MKSRFLSTSILFFFMAIASEQSLAKIFPPYRQSTVQMTTYKTLLTAAAGLGAYFFFASLEKKKVAPNPINGTVVQLIEQMVKDGNDKRLEN